MTKRHYIGSWQVVGQIGSAVLRKPGDIFTYDVKLEIDGCADLDALKIGMLESKWDDIYLESVVGGIANSKTYAIDGDAALVGAEIAAAYHLRCSLVLESVGIAAIGILKGYALCGGVHMSLHYVAVESTVGGH